MQIGPLKILDLFPPLYYLRSGLLTLSNQDGLDERGLVFFVALIVNLNSPFLYIIVNQGTTSHNIDVCLRETTFLLTSFTTAVHNCLSTFTLIWNVWLRNVLSVFPASLNVGCQTALPLSTATISLINCCSLTLGKSSIVLCTVTKR